MSKPSYTRAAEASARITFASISLARASHVTQRRVRVVAQSRPAVKCTDSAGRGRFGALSAIAIYGRFINISPGQ